MVIYHALNLRPALYIVGCIGIELHLFGCILITVAGILGITRLLSPFVVAQSAGSHHIAYGKRFALIRQHAWFYLGFHTYVITVLIPFCVHLHVHVGNLALFYLESIGNVKTGSLVITCHPYGRNRYGIAVYQAFIYPTGYNLADIISFMNRNSHYIVGIHTRYGIGSHQSDRTVPAPHSRIIFYQYPLVRHLVDRAAGKIGISRRSLVILSVHLCDIEEQLFLSQFLARFDRNFYLSRFSILERLVEVQHERSLAHLLICIIKGIADAGHLGITPVGQF